MPKTAMSPGPLQRDPHSCEPSEFRFPPVPDRPFRCSGLGHAPKEAALSAPTDDPQPRQFTADDGSVYVGVPADEFPDFSDVDHTAVDEQSGEVRDR